MHRTQTSRPAGGALLVILTVILALALGALAGPALAEDPDSGPTDGPAPTSTTTEEPGAEPTEADPNLGRELLDPPGPSAAVNDYLVLRRGLSAMVNVATNDTCTGTCTFQLVSKPTGWPVSMTASGLVSLKVPGATRPSRYPISYRMIVNGMPGPTGQLIVAVTPDNYSAPGGMTFTHPYRKGYRNLIRNKILRTIDSVPGGGYIRVASWSFSSKLYRQALKRARARGVVVQIVLAMRNRPTNSDWRILRDTYGTRVTPTGSWVRKCRYSCRGTGGTMHSKIFLFSQVYRTPYVAMTGSANLTDFAVSNQWNQMNTTSGTDYKPVYDEAVRIFTQMAADRPASPQYVATQFPNLTSYYYPRGGVSPANDFMLKALAPIRCTGAKNAGAGGRTIVKIAMYAWYQDRGKWLAKRVRQLWGQGCQVQIVYAISSDPVKRILYSPSGRGRIPMRQILLTNKEHVPIYYLHDKWVAITGHYGSNPSASLSFQGSFNFSDLGFRSDEQFQMLPGRATYDRFARDFNLLWKDRQARAPSPISKFPTIEGRYSGDDLRLGTGVYRYMEAD